jgi:hypothetical protein
MPALFEPRWRNAIKRWRMYVFLTWFLLYAGGQLASNFNRATSVREHPAIRAHCRALSSLLFP